MPAFGGDLCFYWEEGYGVAKWSRAKRLLSRSSRITTAKEPQFHKNKNTNE